MARGVLTEPAYLQVLRRSLRGRIAQRSIARGLDEAVAGFRGGERGDFAVCDADETAASLSVRGLTIVFYRETLGERPRIDVEPVFSWAAQEGGPTSGPEKTAFALVVERIAEVRAAATASGADRLEVATPAGNVLAKRLDRYLRNTEVGSGIPVFLNGDRLVSQIDVPPEAGWITAINPYGHAFLGWEGYALRWGTDEFHAAAGPYQSLVRLAHDRAWRTEGANQPFPRAEPMPIPAAALEPSGRPVSPGTDPEEAQAYAVDATAGDVSAFMRANEHPLSLVSGMKMASEIAFGERSGMSVGFVTDLAGRKIGLFYFNRFPCIDVVPQGIRLGYVSWPKIFPARSLDPKTAELTCQSVAALAAEQAYWDVDSMLRGAPDLAGSGVDLGCAAESRIHGPLVGAMLNIRDMLQDKHESFPFSHLRAMTLDADERHEGSVAVRPDRTSRGPRRR